MECSDEDVSKGVEECERERKRYSEVFDDFVGGCLSQGMFASMRRAARINFR